MTQWIENYFHQMLDEFDGPLLKNSEITIQSNHLNHIKTAHGGILMILVDVCGSLVIALKGLNHSSGVSTNINISFTNPAKEDDVLFVGAECIKFGKAMGYADIKIYNKYTRKLIAQSQHVKYIVIALKQSEKAKF
ncbi:22443_t:CDS:2 [Dentiscutata erythropus]|uniref:22443_t:CDS:1 n=1 Tax=Dentiscutata erythropus TaxID=1348616 RepID=A0A9N9H3J3_9GLOM|nr:22443_t:CDS:2 [Dentiscutata erythropus]